MYKIRRHQNIIVKFNKELKESISEKDQEENLYLAFKYITYAEFTNRNLSGKYKYYKKLIKEKLGKNYLQYINI